MIRSFLIDSPRSESAGAEVSQKYMTTSDHPKDIALITTGAPASIKVDAYPYQIFGAIKSAVSWISADSEEDTTVAGREHGGRHYVLEADIGAWELGGEGSRLKPGMSASIDMTTQEKLFFQSYFYRY
ncbi:hypothetical protein ACFSVK_18725 [Azorhizophilus paspali]|uniref:hypothetical protein n=1 Tax=Azorhizophilus paspali TaxID=69963 RepID=UPI003638B242